MPILEHRPIGLEGVDEMLEHAARRGGVPEDSFRLLPVGQDGCSSNSAPTRARMRAMPRRR
jgi:hypothetical protein